MSEILKKTISLDIDIKASLDLPDGALGDINIAGGRLKMSKENIFFEYNINVAIYDEKTGILICNYENANERFFLTSLNTNSQISIPFSTRMIPFSGRVGNSKTPLSLMNENEVARIKELYNIVMRQAKICYVANLNY